MTTRRKLIKVPLSKARLNLAEFIKKAGKDEVVVTVRGRPAAVIIGFGESDSALLTTEGASSPPPVFLHPFEGRHS